MAGLTSMKMAYSGWRYSCRCSDRSLSAMTVKCGSARCKAAIFVTFAASQRSFSSYVRDIIYVGENFGRNRQK